MRVRGQRFRLSVDRPSQSGWHMAQWGGKCIGPMIILQPEDSTEEGVEASVTPQKGLVTYQWRKPTKAYSHESWMAERSLQAMAMLRDTVTCDPQVRRGAPVLKGTRISISQILAAFAEGSDVNKLADDLSLNITIVREFLHGLAIHLSCPIARHEDPI